MHYYKDKLPPVGVPVIATLYDTSGDDPFFWDEAKGVWNGLYNAGGSLVIDASDDPFDWFPATHWRLVD